MIGKTSNNNFLLILKLCSLNTKWSVNSNDYIFNLNKHLSIEKPSNYNEFIPNLIWIEGS